MPTRPEHALTPHCSNFAGIVGPLSMTWDTDLALWRRVIEINSIGLWICCKHELKQMLDQESIAVYAHAHRPANPTFRVTLMRDAGIAKMAARCREAPSSMPPR